MVAILALRAVKPAVWDSTIAAINSLRALDCLAFVPLALRFFWAPSFLGLDLFQAASSTFCSLVSNLNLLGSYQRSSTPVEPLVTTPALATVISELETLTPKPLAFTFLATTGQEGSRKVTDNSKSLRLPNSSCSIAAIPASTLGSTVFIESSK